MKTDTMFFRLFSIDVFYKSTAHTNIEGGVFFPTLGTCDLIFSAPLKHYVGIISSGYTITQK